MKSKFLLLSFLIVSTYSIAQTDPYFTWVSGSDTTDQFAVYGTKGVAASTNRPGARENSVSWTDDDNNLWLFGGHGYTASGAQVYLNDLWKYDIASGLWTWVSGSSSGGQNGIYGTLGAASSTNIPGARQNAFGWKDEAGNLWLFGGNGKASVGAIDYLNDLWKYDISTNQWTWISGSNLSGDSGSYGSIGVASGSNLPPSRYGGNAWYTSNKLWLFGGQGFSAAQERYNDLWCYDILTNEWTWISGSSTADQNGVYGTQGVASAANAPGARQAAVSWIDNAGNFWFFGGYGFPATGAHNYLDDLWKYNVATNQWTWISGTDLTNQPATYGTQNIASTSNLPGARQMSISWKDSDGNFWLFGAWGHIGFSGGPTFGRINDLWKFNTTTFEWTWVAGENWADKPGIYGTSGVASTTNIPGARRMSIGWTDTSNVFWLFGGNGYDKLDTLGLLNDLWKIEIDQAAEIIMPENAQIKVYPVPLQEHLTIQFSDSENHLVELYDVCGKRIEQILVNGLATIDVSAYSHGMYILKSDEGVVKLIK